jgi:hypothetical protein
MNKYEVKHCTGFWLPTNDATIQVHKVDFLDVKIALGSWDEVEDAEDESIFYYMDDEPLEVGMILGDGFVVTHIEETE